MNVVIEILGVALGALVPGVGAIVWAVRQEGKINVLTAKLEAITSRVDGLEERIYSQLDRIEQMLQRKADKL